MQKEVYEFISKKTNDPIIERHTCRVSGEEFAIFQSDKEFYEKISPIFGGKKFQIPFPTLSWEERMRRRMMWRGKKYYYRPCSVTREKQMSIYPPEVEMLAYSNDEYVSDKRDGLEFARDFDFNKTFFEQFAKHRRSTPKNIANSTEHENCEFIINAHKNKNCYMNDETDFSKDCCYGYNMQRCESVLNSFYVRDSQFCHELYQATNCYKVFYSNDVTDCSDGIFLSNCVNCKHCIGCVNQVGLEYAIWNKKVSKETFKNVRNELMSGSHTIIESWKKKFSQFRQGYPVQALSMRTCEKSLGDQLVNTKECYLSFNIDNCENCAYSTDIHYSKNVYDTHIYEGEMLYECIHAGPKGYHQIFSNYARYCAYSIYCNQMLSCSNTFACSGLKHKKYCIFNKQYSEEEYNILVPKIIEYMQTTGERGEFFPSEYSPFPYNDTFASLYFPIHKLVYPDGTEKILDEDGIGIMLVHYPDKEISEATLNLGGSEKVKTKWRNFGTEVNIPSEMGTIKASSLPDTIHDVDQNFLKKALICEDSGRPYRIIGLELDFYKKMGLPLPRKHPEIRDEWRLRRKPMRNLYLRKCDKTGEDILSVYPEGVPFKVYSEDAYRQEVYG